MSKFEVFTVVLSFILGLGIAQILTSTVHVIQARHQVRIRWIPLVWAAALFALHINFLWGTLAFFGVERNAVWYYADLLSVVLVFLSGAFLFPSSSAGVQDDLGEFFSRDGELALIPLAIYELLAVPYNLEFGVGAFALGNVLHYIGFVLLGVAFFARPRWAIGGATVLYALMVVYGSLFAWASPATIS